MHLLASVLLLAAVVGALAPAAQPARVAYELAPLATSTDASYNWAGYVAEDGRYSAVSGRWVVPEAAPHPGAELSAEAAWVGIGGAKTRDLIQAGTQALASEDGSVQYAAWYELLPAASVPVPLPVAAGDVVGVSVTHVGGTLWHIGFINETKGESHDLTVRYRSSFSSAEWVQEMPSLARHGSFIPLSDFGAIAFLGGSTVKDGVAHPIASAGALPLRMINAEGEPLAVPTALAPSGGFSVLRTDALATPRSTRTFLLPQDF